MTKFMLIAIKWHRRIVRIKVGLHGDFSELPPRGIGGFGRLFAIEKRKGYRIISHTGHRKNRFGAFNGDLVRKVHGSMRNI